MAAKEKPIEAIETFDLDVELAPETLVRSLLHLKARWTLAANLLDADDPAWWRSMAPQVEGLLEAICFAMRKSERHRLKALWLEADKIVLRELRENLLKPVGDVSVRELPITTAGPLPPRASKQRNDFAMMLMQWVAGALRRGQRVEELLPDLVATVRDHAAPKTRRAFDDEVLPNLIAKSRGFRKKRTDVESHARALIRAVFAALDLPAPFGALRVNQHRARKKTLLRKK